MTISQLEQRLMALENEVEALKERFARFPDASRHWWREDAGRFADDPVFDEIVRLGAQYRKSLRPGSRKRRT